MPIDWFNSDKLTMIAMCSLWQPIIDVANETLFWTNYSHSGLWYGVDNDTQRLPKLLVLFVQPIDYCVLLPANSGPAAVRTRWANNNGIVAKQLMSGSNVNCLLLFVSETDIPIDIYWRLQFVKEEIILQLLYQIQLLTRYYWCLLMNIIVYVVIVD